MIKLTATLRGGWVVGVSLLLSTMAANASVLTQTWYSNIFSPACDTAANGGLGNPSGCSAQTGQSSDPGAPQMYDANSGYNTTVELPAFNEAAVLAANPGKYIGSLSVQLLLTYYVQGEIDILNGANAAQHFTTSTSTTNVGIAYAGNSVSTVATLTISGTTSVPTCEYYSTNPCAAGSAGDAVPAAVGSGRTKIYGENTYGGLGNGDGTGLTANNSGTPASYNVPTINNWQFTSNSSANLSFNVAVGDSNVTGAPTNGGSLIYTGNANVGGQAKVIYSYTLTTIPEPATTALFASGLIGLAALLRRKQKQN